MLFSVFVKGSLFISLMPVTACPTPSWRRKTELLQVMCLSDGSSDTCPADIDVLGLFSILPWLLFCNVSKESFLQDTWACLFWLQWNDLSFWLFNKKGHLTTLSLIVFSSITLSPSRGEETWVVSSDQLIWWGYFHREYLGSGCHMKIIYDALVLNWLEVYLIYYYVLYNCTAKMTPLLPSYFFSLGYRWHKYGVKTLSKPPTNARKIHTCAQLNTFDEWLCCI